MKKIRGTKKGIKRMFILSILAAMFWGNTRAVLYAANSVTIQEREAGDSQVKPGQGDIDVDGVLKQEGRSGTTASSSSAKSQPSTTVTGGGLNDKLASNAKTGDFFQSQNLMIFMVICVLILVLLSGRRRKEQEVSNE